MTREEIINNVNNFLVDEFEIEEELIKPEATWKEIGIDSLDFVDIVVIIDKNFGLKLKGEEMANVQSLQEFYDFLYERLEKNN